MEKAIAETFLPKLLGCEVSPAERSMYELPIKLAGLGVINPINVSSVSVQSVAQCHHSSGQRHHWARNSRPVTDSRCFLESNSEFDSGKYLESVQKARAEAHAVTREKESTTQFEAAVLVLGNPSLRSLRRATFHWCLAVCHAQRKKRHNTVSGSLK